MDVQITHEGSDITNSVIEYTREQAICSGIGTLMLTVAKSSAPTISVGDDIKLYEEGIQKGKYRVKQPTRDNRGNLTLECQDFSWKLTDYFITDVYYIDYPTYTRTWIEKFLNEVGLSYQFKDGVGNGSLVNQNSSLGMSSAYDAIMTLLQQSAWYMYFDNNGICRIGDLEKDFSTPDLRVTEADILTINHELSDSSLRNRAVVWGNANEDREWVLADVTRPTPWDRDSRDIRTVLFSSSNINSVSAAFEICYKLLDEFAQLKDVKTVELAGAYNVDIGNVVRVTSRAWSGKGLVTSIRSNASSKGLITTLVIDEKCPKLLGYYGFLDYVYTAHSAAGVWRKYLTGSTWESFSNGIDAGDMHVTDLIVKGGIFACVGNGYLYYRNSDNISDTWSKFTPPYLPDQSGGQFDPTAVTCVAVDIDTYSHNIYAGYKLTDLSEQFLGYQRYWVVAINSLGTVLSYEQVYFVWDEVNYENFKGIDVAKYDNGSRLPVATAPASYGVIDNPGAIFGTRHVMLNIDGDPNSYCFGPLANDAKQGGNLYSVPTVNYGRNINWEGNLAIGLDQFNQFSLFDYKKFNTTDDSLYYAIRTNWLPGFPTWYPSTPYTLAYRYTFWDGNTSPGASDIFVTDLATSGRQMITYSYKLAGLQDWENHWYEVKGYTSTASVTLVGVQNIDGHLTIYDGEAVFLKDQEDPVENGYWLVNTKGAWTRHWSWIPHKGMIIQPLAGVANKDHCFQLVPDFDGDPVLGVTPMTFKEVLNIKESTTGIVYDGDVESGGNNGGGYPHDWFVWIPHALEDSIIIMYRVPDPTCTNDVGIVHYKSVTVTKEGGISNTLLESYHYDKTGEVSRRTVSQSTSAPVGRGLGVISYRVDGESHNLVRHIAEPGGGRVEQATIFTTPAIQTAPCGCPGGGTIRTSTGGTATIKWVGFTFVGQNREAFFRITMRGHSNYQTEGFCLQCGQAGEMYTERGYWVRGTMFGGQINADYRGTIWSELYCIYCAKLDSNVCCETTPRSGSIDFTDDVIGGYIIPLVSRWRPCYLYGNFQLREPYGDTVIHTFEHATDEYSICRQLDDFDGGVYITDPTNAKMYKEIPGAGTVAVCSGPTSHGSMLFAHGCLMKETSTGNSIVSILDKNFILNGLNLCYLLENKNDVWGEPTGTFTIRDFDFYAFDVEDSQPEPLISWTYPPALFTYTFSGISYSGWWPENMKVHKTLNYFKGIPVSGMFNDGRTFNFLGTTVSGIDVPYGTHALMATRENHVDILPTSTVSGISVFVTTSGVPYSLETTNYGTNPYIFIGVTPAGFWQKDAYENEYVNYPGHPASDFLSIRADDRL